MHTEQSFHFCHANWTIMLFLSCIRNALNVLYTDQLCMCPVYRSQMCYVFCKLNKFLCLFVRWLCRAQCMLQQQYVFFIFSKIKWHCCSAKWVSIFATFVHRVFPIFSTSLIWLISLTFFYNIYEMYLSSQYWSFCIGLMFSSYTRM